MIGATGDREPSTGTTVLVDAPRPARRPAPELHDCAECGPAGVGEKWTDPCGCGCMRSLHNNSDHERTSRGPGATCSGRNMAGPCRRCGPDRCPRFRPKEKK